MGVLLQFHALYVGGGGLPAFHGQGLQGLHARSQMDYLCRQPTGSSVSGLSVRTQTHTTCLRNTAVHLQFARLRLPHSYRSTFLPSSS